MVVFIEGTTDNTNGDLRQGFSKLLEKKAKGKLPRIIMGDGKATTIKKFVNSKDSLLLCDLDAPEEDREEDLKTHHLIERKNEVFYMIQEMEAWFISQPEVLDNYYNTEISLKLAKKHASKFAKPDEELQRITKDTNKGTYHKVRHGVKLLEMLDAQKLCTDFPDFKSLIDCLLKS